MLKVTLKARGDAGRLLRRAALSWHEPGWAEQFKGLAPPPPRPVARARVPRAVRPREDPADVQDCRLGAGGGDVLEEERAFRVELAAFLGMGPVELYSPVFCNRPLPMGACTRRCSTEAGTTSRAARNSGCACAPRWGTTSAGRPARVSACGNYEHGHARARAREGGAPALEGTD